MLTAESKIGYCVEISYNYIYNLQLISPPPQEHTSAAAPFIWFAICIPEFFVTAELIKWLEFIFYEAVMGLFCLLSKIHINLKKATIAFCY